MANNEKRLEVYACRIEKKLSETDFNYLLGMTDPAKQDRVKRFRQWQDAHLTLFADLIVRSLIIRQNKCQNNEISFIAGLYGKPTLKSDPAFQFNVSHSGQWIVCAVDTTQVGIDIEQLSAIDLSVSEAFFSRSEHMDILRSVNPEQKFIELWTLKEAYLKLIGMGLSHPLDSFSIRFSVDGHISIEEEGSILTQTHFRQYDIAGGYKMAVCARHNEFPANWTSISSEEIIGIFRGI
jgi:4'-phosphopantetheinyl transferase